MSNESANAIPQAADDMGTNMLVFRQNAEHVSGNALTSRLMRAIENSQQRSLSSILDALLLAGKVECALSDRGHFTADLAIRLTDQIAKLFVDPKCRLEENPHSLTCKIAGMLPETLGLTEPEGFAYYALHPGDFSDTFGEVRAPSVAVIGIRSIGTTLSAVAAATLRAHGHQASRVTVRPEGHPYNRRTRFSPAQEEWVYNEHLRGSLFFIVDEGPGLSGSSFLSAAECLMAMGIDPNRICLVGTRNVDATRLCSPNAATRWSKFQWRQVKSRIYERCRRMASFSGGHWRELLLPANAAWPASWVEMETVKFCTPDNAAILKFDGLGESGRRLRDRATAIHDSRYGPKPQDAGDGLSSYGFVSGEPLTRLDVSNDLLEHFARYCAFRLHEFKGLPTNDDLLRQMVHHNFCQETGRAMEIPEEALQTEHPTIADGRMQPHKWIRTRDGVLKVDGAMHGCDHFLPGPTDIAWDLAGVIIEWNMGLDAQQHFFSAFQKQCQYDTGKLPWFLLAYATFRVGYCKMAGNATQDPAEKARFCKAHLYYRDKMLEAAATVL